MFSVTSYTPKVRYRILRVPSAFATRLLPVEFASPRRFPTVPHILQRCYRKRSFIPSDEQAKIIRLCRENNVVVSACPGSGKTATVEGIVKSYPQSRIFYATYSRRLQEETSRLLLPYPNVYACTLHGLACKLFGANIFDDAKLIEEKRKASLKNEFPRWRYRPFDIIIIDEIQDCTEILYWLLAVFFSANAQAAGGRSARIVVLGDERQSIYGFRGADSRYLTLAPEIFAPFSPHPWERVPLRGSFRLPDPSVDFINDVFLSGSRHIIGTSKPGPKPILLRCNPFDTARLVKELLPLVKKYGQENSAILAPSVRKKGPLPPLVNMLSERHGVQISVPISDDAPLDDRVIKGKLCVHSIHQFKGSERDLIILAGMDNTYFQFFQRETPSDYCPNEIYVALSRARKQLVLIHDDHNKMMPFISMEALYRTAKIVNLTERQTEIAPPASPNRSFRHGLHLDNTVWIRRLVRFLRGDLLEEIIHRYVRICKISSPLPEAEHIDIPDVVPSEQLGKHHESVSDINGLIVVAAFELSILGSLVTLGEANDIAQDTVTTQHQVNWLCRRACHYEAKVSGYKHRSIQMKNNEFDWITIESFLLAQERLKSQFERPATQNPASSLVFEQLLQQGLIISGQDTQLLGIADIIENTNSQGDSSDEHTACLWEIKFASSLSNEHVAQACLYGLLYGRERGIVPRILLYNVRDGEKWEITPLDGLKSLLAMTEDILRLKYTTPRQIGDDEFMEQCEKVGREVLQGIRSEKGTDRDRS